MAAAKVPIGVNSHGSDQNQFLLELKDRLEVGCQEPGEFVDLYDEDIVQVCNIVKRILKAEPVILEIESPLYVLGDIHGQFYDILRIFKSIGQTEYRFLFLGDYVDRGPQSVEVIIYLFVLKSLYPAKYYLLRGNHEDMPVCSNYGFKNEMQEKFVNSLCFLDIMEVFNYLPIAALVDETIFCVHGGLCRAAVRPGITNIQQLFENIKRPTTVSGSPLVFGLLWSDPIPDEENASSTAFMKNSSRGGNCERFGHSVTQYFFNHFKLTKLLRGHQFCQNGYKYDHNRKCLTIFSAPGYRKNKNVGAYLLRMRNENEEIAYQINTIHPVLHT